MTGNIRRIYEGIKKKSNQTVQREIITDRGQKMERWVEHYSDLYSIENVVTCYAIEAIKPLSTMKDLDIEPSAEELIKAIDSLACERYGVSMVFLQT